MNNRVKVSDEINFLGVRMSVCLSEFNLAYKQSKQLCVAISTRLIEFSFPSFFEFQLRKHAL